MRFGGEGEFKSDLLTVYKNNWYGTITCFFLQLVLLIMVRAGLTPFCLGERKEQMPLISANSSLTFKLLIYSPLHPFNKTGLRISPSGLSLQIYIFKLELASNVNQRGLSCLKSHSRDCWWREMMGRLSGCTARLCLAAPDKAVTALLFAGVTSLPETQL